MKYSNRIDTPAPMYLCYYSASKFLFVTGLDTTNNDDDTFFANNYVSGLCV